MRHRYNALVIEARILPALHARLAAALAPPRAAARAARRRRPARRRADDSRARSASRRSTTCSRSTTSDCASVPSLDDAATRTARARARRAHARRGRRLTAWRDERYEARAGDALPASRSRRARRRALLRHRARQAVHVNGLVRRPTAAPRCGSPGAARTRRSIPGMLDNLVGGGIAAGASVARHAASRRRGKRPASTPRPRARARSAGMVHVRRLAARRPPARDDPRARPRGCRATSSRRTRTARSSSTGSCRSTTMPRAARRTPKGPTS